MSVNFSEFHVKNNLCGKKQPMRKTTLCACKKKFSCTCGKKTHQTVEGKAPVLRIICKGLENGL